MVEARVRVSSKSLDYWLQNQNLLIEWKVMFITVYVYEDLFESVWVS